jgi:hypothetical protein
VYPTAEPGVAFGFKMITYQQVQRSVPQPPALIDYAQPEEDGPEIRLDADCGDYDCSGVLDRDWQVENRGLSTLDIGACFSADGISD